MSAGETGLPMPRRNQAIIAISLGTALLVVDNAVSIVALPTIAADFGVPASASVAVVVVYQLVLLMAILPFSALGDRIGHKRLYQSGQAVFLAATLVSAFAVDLPMLLAGRAAQAFGVAAALSVSSAMLRRIYPASSLGRGFGLNSVIIAFSAALAPTLGGLLLGLGVWRWVFAAAAPFAVLSLVLGRSLPDSAPGTAKYDLGGAVSCALVFGAVIGGLQLLAQGGRTMMAAALTTAGMVGGWLFIRRERTRPNPTLPVDLLGRPIFALSALAALGAFTASLCFSLSLPFRLEIVHGFSPPQVGLMMAAWPLAMMAAAPVAGWLSDRAPRGVLGGTGMIITAAGLLLMALTPVDAGVFRLVLPLVLGGAGFGLFVAPNAHQIVGSAPPHRTASAGAIISTTRLVGSALGATILAGLFWLGLGEGPAPSLAAAACVIAAAVCSFANLLFVRNPKHGKRQIDHAPL